MKLQRVKLRNYRGVVKSDVSFWLNGVTIVEGPNEIGKTAIAEGLQMAIDLPDSSRNSQVKAVQPVGRSLCQMLWKLPPGGLAHQAATAFSALTGNSVKIPSSNRAPSISKPHKVSCLRSADASAHSASATP